MENEPERVAKLKGISSEKAQDFSNQLKANTGIRTLMLYLGEYGISNTSAVKIFNVFGAGSVERIKENPYILCQGDFGVNFERADFIAKREKLEHDSEVRLRAGIVYILRHNEGNGHTCLPREKLISIAEDFLGVEAEKLIECAEQMIFDRSLIADKIGDKEFLFTPQMHLSEIDIASRVKMMMSFPAEQVRGIDDAIAGLEEGAGITTAELQK